MSAIYLYTQNTDKLGSEMSATYLHISNADQISTKKSVKELLT